MNSRRLISRGGLAAVLALAGCIAEEQSAPVMHSVEVLKVDAPAPELASAPADGWTWEELAVRAGEKAMKTGRGSMRAMEARLKAEEDLAWKDPELRLSRSWFDGKGDRNYRDKWDETDGRDWGVGLRLFIPNPFINRYLRKKGAATVDKYNAESVADGYAVYTEVKLMCLENNRLENELKRRQVEGKIIDRGKELADASREDGVSESPYDTIRMRAKKERNQLRIDVLVRHIRRLHHQIALAANVKDEDFKIIIGGIDLPDPKQMNLDDLVEKAFARRPDLARANAQYREAEAKLGMARAANIPWFKSIEGGYARQHKTKDSHEIGLLKDVARSHKDETYLKLTISLPVFTWLGDSVEISRQIRDTAEARVREMYDSIRLEVASGYERYCETVAAVKTDEVAAFAREMEERINDYEDSGADIAAASIKARLELNDYLEFVHEVELNACEALIDLESVIGGPTGTPLLPRSNIEDFGFSAARKELAQIDDPATPETTDKSDKSAESTDPAEPAESAEPAGTVPAVSVDDDEDDLPEELFGSEE